MSDPARPILALCLAAMGCMPTAAMTDVRPLDRRCPPSQEHGARIEWHFPVPASDNAQLERWCRVVGSPVVDSIPRGRFGRLARGEPLAISAWNTDVGAGDVVSFLESELGLHCAGPSSARQEGAPHVVLLMQEALRRSPTLLVLEQSWATPPPAAEEPRAGQRLDVVDVARRCGLSVFYVPAARNGHEQRDGSGEDKGNAILSTLPLSDFIALELPFEAARRVAVGATVRDEAGDSLRVVSVHLITTPQAWRVLTTANSSRARQAAAIIRALERIEETRARPAATPVVAPTTSTVVAGDFNTWSRRESALRILLGHFPESPRPLMQDTRGGFPTDHLLFRRRHARTDAPDSLGPGSYRRIENRYQSDHNPIVALFRFGSDTTAGRGTWEVGDVDP